MRKKNMKQIIQAIGWIGLMLFLAGCASPKFIGTDLGGMDADDFRLKDQNGTMVTLSGLRGKVVALSFLYTRCTDTCPVVVERFRQTADELGPEAERVVFVAVSLDPEGDTVEAVKNFLAVRKMTERMVYLIGSRAELELVWRPYGIYAEPVPNATHQAGHTIAHTDRLVLIDRQGKQRVNLISEVSVSDLVYNIRILLK